MKGRLNKKLQNKSFEQQEMTQRLSMELADLSSNSDVFF